MGFRGPLRDPDSIRGQRETGGVTPIPVQEDLAPPSCLKGRKERDAFDARVAAARASGVSVMQIDAPAYARLAKLDVMVQNATDPDMLSRLSRTILPLEQALGLNHMARARSGVKMGEKKQSKTAQLLQMAKQA